MDTVFCHHWKSNSYVSLPHNLPVLLIPRHNVDTHNQQSSSTHLSCVMWFPQVNGTWERPRHWWALCAACGERPGRRRRQPVHHRTAVTSRHRWRSGQWKHATHHHKSHLGMCNITIYTMGQYKFVYRKIFLSECLHHGSFCSDIFECIRTLWAIVVFGI